MDEEEAYNAFGHGFLKRLYKRRENWANEGTGINAHSKNQLEGPKIDTLDNMQNMKDQYGSMYIT